MSDTWISLILNLLLTALKWYGASADTLAKYQELIESTKNDGLISVDSKDKFISQKEAILARLKARQNPGGIK